MSDYDTKWCRYEQHRCMTCGEPERFRSESPDDRLCSSYCHEHVSAWLLALYVRRGMLTVVP